MKRVFATVLALVMCLSLFAACGGGTSSSAPASTPASTPAEPASTPADDGADNEPVTITHWYWCDNDDYAKTMDEMVADFNATNGKNITVVAEQQPWDGGGYSTNLLNVAVGGGGPDTASFKLTATPSFVANDLLVNLDPYIENWADKDDINENLYNIMRQASGTDSVYVMPWNTQILYVYYRPSYFKAAEIEVPTTYEEFLEACKKLTVDADGDGTPEQYGFSMRGSKGGQEPWGSFIMAAGGSWEELNSADAVKGMQDFIDLYTNHYVPDTAPNDGFQETIETNFKSGKCAMVIHHTGSYKGMVDTFGDDVDAFQFPAGKGRWTSMGDTENVMFERCENKDAAFEWLAYLATGKGQETWCTVTGNVPVSSRVQQMAEFQDNRFMKASIEGTDFAGILPILDTTSEFISDVWPATVQQALLGDMTAQEAMDTLQKALWG